MANENYVCKIIYEIRTEKIGEYKEIALSSEHWTGKAGHLFDNFTRLTRYQRRFELEKFPSIPPIRSRYFSSAHKTISSHDTFFVAHNFSDKFEWSICCCAIHDWISADTRRSFEAIAKSYACNAIIHASHVLFHVTQFFRRYANRFFPAGFE